MSTARDPLGMPYPSGDPWREEVHRRLTAMEEDHDLVITTANDVRHLAGDVRAIKRWLVAATFTFAAASVGLFGVIIELSGK